MTNANEPAHHESCNINAKNPVYTSPLLISELEHVQPTSTDMFIQEHVTLHDIADITKNDNNSPLNLSPVTSEGNFYNLNHESPTTPKLEPTLQSQSHFSTSAKMQTNSSNAYFLTHQLLNPHSSQFNISSTPIAECQTISSNFDNSRSQAKTTSSLFQKSNMEHVPFSNSTSLSGLNPYILANRDSHAKEEALILESVNHTVCKSAENDNLPPNIEEGFVQIQDPSAESQACALPSSMYMELKRVHEFDGRLAESLQLFYNHAWENVHQQPIATNPVFAISRIKKVMKIDDDVEKYNLQVSTDAAIVMEKLCQLFMSELGIRSSFSASSKNRKVVQREDITEAIQQSDTFDFLLDVMPQSGT